MASVILLIGIPASGKSTLAYRLWQYLQNQGESGLIISPDQIRARLYGSADRQGVWTEIWQEVRREFVEAYDGERSVIYDATNARSPDRQEVINFVKSCGFKPITGIWLNSPLWICLARNQGRSHPVPEAVMLEMSKCLGQAPPHLREGFDRLMIQDEGAIDDSLL